jgi:hypothetical protein
MLKCGDEGTASVWNLQAVTSMFAAQYPILTLGAPVSNPFVHLLTVIPQVPVYDIADIKQMPRFNDTINVLAVRDMVMGLSKPYPNPSKVFSGLKGCQNGIITLGGECPDCDYDFVSSLDSSTPISPVSTFRKSPPATKNCLPDDVMAFDEALSTTLDKINNASSSAEFMKAVNTLNLVQNFDAYIGCNSLIDTMTTKASKFMTVFGGRNCEADPSTPEWASDPCCNYALQFTMCCAQQTRSVKIDVLSEIKYPIVNATVPSDANSTWITPQVVGTDESGALVYYPSATGYSISDGRQAVLDSLVSALNQHVQAEGIMQDTSEGCEAKLKSAIPPNYLDNALAFVSKCVDSIFRMKTVAGKGSCAADSDCYTTCDKKTHQCSFPTTGPNGNLDNAFVRCAVDKMKPDVLLYIRDQLNVASLPEQTGPEGLGFNERMAQALTEAVSTKSCDGPAEYSDGACLIDMPDSDCANKNLQLDPSIGNGLTLVGDGMIDTDPDIHSGLNVQFKYIIIRTDVKDRVTCLSLKPGSEFVQWVNVTMNGDSGRMVCRIKMPLLPIEDTQAQSPSDAPGLLCADYTEPINGQCSDGSTPKDIFLESTDSTSNACFDGSIPDSDTNLCSDGHTPDWKPDPSLPCQDGSWTDPYTGRCPDGVDLLCDEGMISNITMCIPLLSYSSNSADAGSGVTSDSDGSSGSRSKSKVARRKRRSLSCASRRDLTENDPCSSIKDVNTKRTCILEKHFLFLCNAVPDIEHLFDPKSFCTTLADRFPALSVIDHKLAGVGRCKVTNFGITPNGLLPFGYMMDDSNGNYFIDWRSPLGQYLNSDQIPVNISSSGDSIANTRCQQTAIALKAIGLQATSSKFYRYKTKTISVYNSENDEFSDVTFTGNDTMCLLEKKCNSDSGAAILAGTTLNQAQCTTASPSRPVMFFFFSSPQGYVVPDFLLISASILRSSPRFIFPPTSDQPVSLLCRSRGV